MKLGFYNFYAFYNGNRMFTDASSPIGDDLMYPFVHLARQVRSHGHSIATIDTAPLESFDAVVFLDYPTKLNPYFRRLLAHEPATPMYLVTFEAPTLRPDNWTPQNQAPFRKIFTWRTDLVDGKRYIGLNQSCRILRDRKYFDAPKDGFCTLIAGNKFGSDPVELYSERVRAIRWFERHHPEEFDLYGIGWDRWYPGAAAGKLNFALAAAYRRMPWLPKSRSYPSYRGSLRTKRDTLARYRFSICYENAIFPGYVTEKMLDCFMAGVVPVYLGAPDVTQHIPADTFIDKREYPTYEALYERLRGIGDDEHRGYLERIWRFMEADGLRPWSAEYFAETLEREIAG
jgi:hypothetical protein